MSLTSRIFNNLVFRRRNSIAVDSSPGDECTGGNDPINSNNKLDEKY